MHGGHMLKRGDKVKVKNIYLGRVDGEGTYVGLSKDHKGKHLVHLHGMDIPVDESDIEKIKE